MTLITGPKISSEAIRIPGRTSAKTVGCRNQPALGDAGGPLAAGHERRAVLHARLHVAQHALVVGGGDERAHVGLLRVRHGHGVLAHPLGGAGDEAS
jgi:hypothetical protein